MTNNFKYTSDNKRYHTLNYAYQQQFNCKVFKVSLNAGFTCPNIDGTKGYGGCIYCLDGSSQFGGNVKDSLLKQFEEISAIERKKNSNCKFIGYFQANSNTYAPVEVLKEKYETILKLNDVVGLNIATRPDCITDECLDYLIELNKKTYLTIELGLQTIHDESAKFINRGHDLKCFTDTVQRLRKNNINVVVHIINGLPYETKEMMLETITYLNKLDINGIKIHMLHINKKSKLSEIYNEKPFPILTKDEYVDITCNQLEILRPEIIIHRLTADTDNKELIEPIWLRKKIDVLNSIDKELARRNTYQGFNLSRPS